MRARERRILPLLLPLLLLWGCAGRVEAAPAPTEEPEESAKETAEESVPVLTWGQYSTPADAQELQLAGEDISLRELRSLLEQMTAAPALVELGEQSYDAGELAPLCADYPLTRFVCAVELFGQSFPSGSAELDLSEVPMTDTKELEAALCCFPALEKVLMLHCGLDNDTMDALNARHEGVSFVWMVPVMRTAIRSDRTYFTNHNPDEYTKSYAPIANLRYCHELIAVDLGHFHITDEDFKFVSGTPKLQFLIIAISNVHSIELLRGCPELRYLEAFWAPIDDLTPLLDCPKLTDLNLSNMNRLDTEDLEVLGQMKQLEHLWLAGTLFTPEQMEPLRAALPDTEILQRYGTKSGATDDGWREHPIYFEMRDAFHMFYLK